VKEVVVASAVRTPIGNFGGIFSKLRAVDLGIIVTKESMRRANIEPYMVDEVIFGNARPAGNGPNIARQILVRSGIPVEKPAFTINKACASGIKTVALGAQAILLEDAEVVIAGGTESMSTVPYLLDRARWGYRLGGGELIDSMYRDGYLCPLAEMVMGETVELLAQKYNISREEQDIYAFESHKKAVDAINNECFKEEIIPVEVKKKKEIKIVTRDEHPREDTNIEKLSKLPPVFRKDGTITAGNSSAITDAASAVVLMTVEKAKELGISPLAKIGAFVSVGVDPKEMGLGPVPAVNRLLNKVDMKIEDIDVIELNEAFAAQVLAVERELKYDRSKRNINGGAIALGHPTAATGTRIITTLLYTMKRLNAKFGLATLCVSGGLGMAMLFEREVD
jgi:acetyl-CoA C-acetyltransferase